MTKSLKITILGTIFYILSLQTKEVYSTAVEGDIEFIHIGKTGGATLQTILRKSWTFLEKGTFDNSYQVPLRVKSIAHNGKPHIDEYNKFIVTARNPLERMISWFFFEHPKNRRELSYNKNGDVIFQCYDELDDLVSEGLSLRFPSEKKDKLCQEVAREVIKGSCRGKNVSGSFMQMNNNYKFYLEDLFKKDEEKKKEIYVVRTEEFDHDLRSINELLGGTSIVEYRVSTHTGHNQTFPVSNKKTKLRGKYNACFFLCPEIQLYKKLLHRAVNLSQEDLKKSLDKLSETCPLEAKNDFCNGKSYHVNQGEKCMENIKMLNEYFFAASGEEHNLHALGEVKILLPKHIDRHPDAILRKLRSIDPTPIDSSCRATSQLELIIPNDNSQWIIQSMDSSGNKKTVGGDEMYITYVDKNFESHIDATAVAHVKDNEDGTYGLEFVSIKQNLPQDITYAYKGSLTLHMQYTCSIGKIWPPAKAKWKSSGAIYHSYATKLDISPHVSSPKPLKLEVDLRSYDVVLAVGDSIMHQLFCIHNLMRRKNMFHDRKLGTPLNTGSLKGYISWLNATAIPALKPFRKTALLLNTGAWDIAHDREGKIKSIDEHVKTLELLIVIIRQMLPQTDIIWRGTTAMHLHRAPFVEKLTYVSNSRVKALNDAQLKLMRRLHIPVLDLYKYTYGQAHNSKTNDAVHFMDFVHTNIMNELYPEDNIVADSGYGECNLDMLLH